MPVSVNEYKSVIFFKFSFFKYILLIRLLQLSQFFSPLYPPSALHHSPTSSIPPFSSYPCVIPCVIPLASPFPILFLTSPCLFCAYQLCFLSPETFPLILPFPLPTDNPPCDLHFCDSVTILIICLVFVFQVKLLILVSLL